jgi:hypothetical protein
MVSAIAGIVAMQNASNTTARRRYEVFSRAVRVFMIVPSGQVNHERIAVAADPALNVAIHPGKYRSGSRARDDI